MFKDTSYGSLSGMVGVPVLNRVRMSQGCLEKSLPCLPNGKPGRHRSLDWESSLDGTSKALLRKQEMHTVKENQSHFLWRGRQLGGKVLGQPHARCRV